MSSGYRRIFWGFFIMNFHINIGIIKILPPFIGLIVIGRGVELLYENSKHYRFKEAKKFVILATIFSIVFELLGFIPIEGILWELTSSVLMAAYAILNLLFIFKILEGAIEVLKSEDNLELVDRYIEIQKIHLIIDIISIILINISLIYRVMWLGIVGGIIGIGLIIYIMVAIGKLETLYRQEDPDII